MSGTGIAGAMDYVPAGTDGADTCAICQRTFTHPPAAARAWPERLGLACSSECASSPAWQGRMQIMPAYGDEWI